MQDIFPPDLAQETEQIPRNIEITLIPRLKMIVRGNVHETRDHREKESYHRARISFFFFFPIQNRGQARHY